MVRGEPLPPTLYLGLSVALRKSASIPEEAKQSINLVFCKIYDERFTKQDDIVTFRAGINESSEIQ